jgi:osmoprotectant transport system permease protein
MSRRCGRGAVVVPWLLATGAVLSGAGCAERPIVVGSKKFTESVILGEILTQLLQGSGVPARHAAELGGTRLLWNALRAGEVDVYPEYTGTLCQEILKVACDDDSRGRALQEAGVRQSRGLGFSDQYALAVRPALAAAMHLETISDLVRAPDLRLGFSEEFMARGDGWPALRQRYGLPQTDVRGLDHDLAWRGLDSGTLDVIDAYTTDAEIGLHHPRLLADDRHFFASYQALYVYRPGLPAAAGAALARLEGRISEAEMIAMNAGAKIERQPDAAVAARWLQRSLGVTGGARPEGVWRRIGRRTLEHLLLVAISLAAAIAVGVPLGILAARFRRFGQVILGAVGLLQTIPSLALLVFMIPLLGIGALPALCALLVYSLLPIVRNTAAGIDGIAPGLRESALAIGLSPWQRLRLVELPLAAPSILAGIQTAAVLDVGTATLGAVIGAGGYGQPILTGIRLDDTRLILEGAVPAALLALAVQALFEALGRWLVSPGLRVEPAPE